MIDYATHPHQGKEEHEANYANESHDYIISIGFRLLVLFGWVHYFRAGNIGQ